MERGGGGAESFIDRSKVRILLCDNDPKSSEEAFTLLCKCSYQVTAVKSARQVIDALNAEGPDIDIILAEVDLPMAKGMKMLKYITRDKDLRRIPVIMMSAQDEVSVVVKCLRLGAADYLVKPLRTNELLNLWTHMWRRRRMLGLAEKNLTNFDIDLVASDPSDANTNSATLFSDDTDERTRKSAIPENCISTDDQEDEINEVQRPVMSNAGTTAAPVGLPPIFSLDHRPDVPGISDRRTGQFVSCPKKSELRIGESSSAFCTYVKPSMPRSTTQEVSPGNDKETRNASSDNPTNFWAGQTCLESQRSVNREAKQGCSDTQVCNQRESKDSHSQGDVSVLPRSNSIPDSSFSVETSATPPTIMEYQQQQSNTSIEEFTRMQMMSHHHQDMSGFSRHPGYPYFVPGMMNQVMMSPQGQMFQPPQDLPNHVPPPPSMFPQFGHLPHVPGMAPFPYYPVNMCMQQQGQMPPNQPWPPSYGNPSPAAPEGQIGKVDRRVAALMKFRQKRNQRCFDKKIRYVNRKKLAERRPRVRGQFVRKMNGIDVDLNGEPASADFEDDEEEEDEEEVAARDESPDDDASMGL